MLSFSLAVQSLTVASYCWKLENFGGIAAYFLGSKPYSIWDQIYFKFYFALFYFRPVPRLKFIPISYHSFARYLLGWYVFQVSRKCFTLSHQRFGGGFSTPRFYSKFLKKLIITKSDNNSNCNISTHFSIQMVQILPFFRP